MGCTTNETPSMRRAHRVADAEGLVFPDLSLGGLLRKVADEVPDRVALVDGRQGRTGRWTYAQLLVEAESVASQLAKRYQPGERIALWCANRPEWIIAELSVALAGLVLVPINPAFRGAEVEHVLTSSGASLLVHDQRHRDNELANIAQQLELSIGVRCLDLDELMEARGSNSAVRLPEVGADWPVQVQFTSGSTGPPKGAVLHHRGLVGMPSVAVPMMEVGPTPVWLNVLPLFHIGGCGLSTIGPMVARGTHVLLDRFTSHRSIDLIEREQVTIMGSVPAMLLAMLDTPRSSTSLDSLRIVISGGARVAPELIRTIEADLGVRFIVAFGQTESHGHITQTRPDDAVADKAETVGRPLPHVEVKVVEPTSSEVKGFGQTGELLVRSPMLMSEYLGLPEKTALAFDQDGFLRTGDFVEMDPRGYLKVSGRVGDTISRGGENIAPDEIEAVLLEHAEITAAAVVGIPDQRLGESVAACVSTVGVPPDVAELERFVAERLAPAKVPRAWRFVEQMPMTPTGKLQRFRLREAFVDPPGM